MKKPFEENGSAKYSSTVFLRRNYPDQVRGYALSPKNWNTPNDFFNERKIIFVAVKDNSSRLFK